MNREICQLSGHRRYANGLGNYEERYLSRGVHEWVIDYCWVFVNGDICQWKGSSMEICQWDIYE